MIEVLKIRARRLRKNSTDAEHHLWYLLRDRRLNRHKFRRQYVIQPYIVDFVCLKRKLIIKLDGGQHADLQQADATRSLFLKLQGYRILRFWNEAVFKETENVVMTIFHALEN